MTTDIGQIVWQPSPQKIQASFMTKFAQFVSDIENKDLLMWNDLHQWSVEHPGKFWRYCAKFVDIKWRKKPNSLPQEETSIDKKFSSLNDWLQEKTHWFEGAKLNFAENILPQPNDSQVLVSVKEGIGRTSLTAKELWNQVACCALSLQKAGVKKGDRVAGVLSNSYEAIIAMLATTSLGAIWSSCSPDFGVGGIVDRLAQISPKILFFSSSYHYNGKVFSCHQTLRECLPLLPSLEVVIQTDILYEKMTPTFHKDPKYPNLIAWQDFVNFTNCFGQNFNNDEPLPINFVDVEFDHPVYILFSSGTTGIPKCIVHGAGGTLLQHKKELILHCDLSNKDKLFYYTTCGWMMWNWMVSTLSTGASLVTFDGSPGFPTMEALWHLIESEKITVFGTSPKYIQACMNKDIHPQNNHNLESLRTILSTGAPLLPEHYSWVYQNVKSDLHLASISGGTDIISCFMLGNPVLPVRLGEIQCAGLGMAVEAWNNPGKNLQGTKAELVCTRPFASMPVGFWNDKENKKYSAAYFEHFTSHTVWRHGDFIEATPNGGFIIHGRSDSTLNPGGVRIGTAEIYRQVENLIEVEDSLAVGKPVNGDVEIILFVKLAEGSMLNQDLINKIKSEIKTNLTPRHVPAKIIAIDGIPYTRSGKKVETAILKILQGESIPNLSAIANSEVLQQYNKISQTL